MKPLTLHLENVRTFDTLDFEFLEGACAVTGPNGSGKSSTIEALDAALFGSTHWRDEWLSRDRPDATMMIALTFEHAGDLYRIRRSYRKGPKCDLEIMHPLGAHDEAEYWHPLTRESVKATEEEIQRLIGLTRESFQASAYAPQERAGFFCSATAGERMAILRGVLRLDETWDPLKRRASAELKAAEQSLAVVRAKIESAETELNEIPVVKAEFHATKNREVDARRSLEECASQLGKARERLSKLREQSGLREAAERARDAAERAHASLLERIAGLEQQIREAETRLAEREALGTLAEGLPGLLAERDALAEQMQGYLERERLWNERVRLFSLVDNRGVRADEFLEKSSRALLDDGHGEETCDRCGQKFGTEAAHRAAQSYKDEADALLAERRDLEHEAAGITLALDALPTAPPDRDRAAKVHDLIHLGQNAQVKLAALDEVKSRQAAAREELSTVRAELPEREDAAATARAELLALGPHDPDALDTATAEVGRLANQEGIKRDHLDRTLLEIARLDERLARLDKLAHETNRAQLERDHWQREVELLSHLERACGPNGVPALILETSAIPQMEAEWNRVLRLLPTESGDIFEVELHTQRERKSGDGAVDALDVVVYANGQARPYSTYSGGERMRLDVAQRRALSALLAHRKGAECPLMILDEPNSLDDQGMAALAQVLEDLAVAEGLTILCVSHDPALRDAFENSIEIVKEGGRSRIAGTTEPAPTVQEVA